MFTLIYSCITLCAIQTTAMTKVLLYALSRDSHAQNTPLLVTYYFCLLSTNKQCFLALGSYFRNSNLFGIFFGFFRFT